MSTSANPKHRNLLVSLTLTACVAVGLLSCVALAQKQASTRQVERTGSKKRLSQALPEKLGAFVVKTGADRDLTVAEAIEVGKFLAGQADLDTIVKLLHPVDVVEYTFESMTIVGMAEGKKPGDTPKTVQTQLIAASEVTLDNGVELEVGDRLFVGDTITLGFVINAGKDEVILSTDKGEDIVMGVGVLLNAGGCTSVETCDANGNCTSRCEGGCGRAGGDCVRVTVNDPNGGTRSWCECLLIPGGPPK